MAGAHCPKCCNILDFVAYFITSIYFSGQADGEADDTEMTEKLQSNDETEENNQSNDLSQSEDENEPMETGDTKQMKERQSPPLDETDNGSDRLENGHISPSLLEVMRKSNFPSDILTLKKVDESVFCETGVPWMVLSAVPLPKGSSIGPYAGEMVALTDLRDKQHILQVYYKIRTPEKMVVMTLNFEQCGFTID